MERSSSKLDHLAVRACPLLVRAQSIARHISHVRFPPYLASNQAAQLYNLPLTLTRFVARIQSSFHLFTSTGVVLNILRWTDQYHQLVLARQCALPVMRLRRAVQW
jgi:hypothetical protein